MNSTRLGILAIYQREYLNKKLSKRSRRKKSLKTETMIVFYLPLFDKHFLTNWLTIEMADNFSPEYIRNYNFFTLWNERC